MVSPLPSLVTLQQAKHAARMDPNYHDEDADLYMRLETAHALVLDNLDNQIDDTDDVWLDTMLAWTSDTAPKAVKAAILAMFTHLVRFRGDEGPKDAPDNPDGDLPQHVRMLLKRYRDPTVA